MGSVVLWQASTSTCTAMWTPSDQGIACGIDNVQVLETMSSCWRRRKTEGVFSFGMWCWSAYVLQRV